MAFKVTEWAYQNMDVSEPAEVEEGVQYLSIMGASFEEDSGIYSIQFKSLSNEAQFTIKYWTVFAGKDGFITPNVRSRQTLVTLGTALAGTPIGIPNPVDIVGGVVMAKVVLNPSKTNPDRKFTNIYSYDPVPESIALGFANIDQYYVEDPEETASEEVEE